MSTDVLPERRDEEDRDEPWQSPRESAPSRTRADEPTLARRVAMLGFMLLVLGALALALNAAGRTSGLIGVNLGSLFVLGGLALLLFHAASDREYQVRRTYSMFGLTWLLGAGLLFALIASQGRFLFGPAFACLLLGLFFLLASLRHETDDSWRQKIVAVIGGVGAILALVGFVGGSLSGDFLLPFGMLLALVGLAYLWAVVGLQGTSDTRGYWMGVGIGVLGAVVFLFALGRSALPSWFYSWGWISSQPASYLVPSGLLLMGLGAAYAALSAGLVADAPFIVLVRRELAAFFYSPIAYIVLVGMTFIGWALFIMFVWRVLDTRQEVMEPIVQSYILQWGPVISLIFIVPVLTMRLLSEENRSGTLEVLLTAPVSETAVVLSKFVAVLFFFLLAWMPWGLFLVGLRLIGQQPFDYRPLLSFFIALACTGGGFLSMGMFFSSLTRNQIASAVMTFAVVLGATFLIFGERYLEMQPPTPTITFWTTVVKHVSYIDLWGQTLSGLLVPQFLLFPLSATVLWLFMTVKVLEIRRWS